MGIYGYFILCFAVVLWLYHRQVQKWFDADEGQHHFASLLIAAAKGISGVSRADVAQQYGVLAKKGGGARARLNHAMTLVRRSSDAQTYAKALEIARGL
jgi:hypothetical protein